MEKIRIDYTNKIINPQKLWGIFFIDKDNINYLFINIYLLTICLSSYVCRYIIKLED